jgi:hypothetical protein
LPTRSPDAVTELCEQLETDGIPSWLHGEALLDTLRPRPRRESPPAGGSEAGYTTAPLSRPPRVTPTLLCAAEPAALLAALPRAVVTASHARRLTLATAAGPVDLLPIGPGDDDRRLADFGLSAFALARRPGDGEWHDPVGARARFAAGELDLVGTHPNPFARAPRRYWIAARLLAEYALEPTERLVDAAREALPAALEALPGAAPARRELARVLMATRPETGLAFLRRVGVSEALVPGVQARSEGLVGRLPLQPALRWAVWLRGTSIPRALVRFRMPIDLARRIERLERLHPLDRRLEAQHEAATRKGLARLEEAEVEGLLAWRRLELEASPPGASREAATARLDDVAARIASLRAERERTGRVRSLALDGRAVMEALESGPGPHVGRALAHLAAWIGDDPARNTPDALRRELQAWAEREGEPIR